MDSHFSLQEYLAAMHAQKQRLSGDLLGHIQDPWWWQTLIFFSALGNASMVITECHREANLSVASLTLAVQWLDEASQMGAQLRGQIEAIRDQWIDDPSPDRRKTAAEVILSLRISRMTPSGGGREVDLKRITNAEYQLFVDEMRERGQNYRPDYWSSDRFPPSHGLEEVVGVRPGDAQAFCGWLTSRAQDGSRFELPNEDEIEEPGHWSRSQTGLVCKPPAGSGNLITQEQLQARFDSDFRRSSKWKVGYHGNPGEIGASEEKLLPQSSSPV